MQACLGDFTLLTIFNKLQLNEAKTDTRRLTNPSIYANTPLSLKNRPPDIHFSESARNNGVILTKSFQWLIRSVKFVSLQTSIRELLLFIEGL